MQTLQRGVLIPTVPLALTADRGFDERRERALLRYYAAAGAGGLAVGVHTTQFAIRDPKIGLFELWTVRGFTTIGHLPRIKVKAQVLEGEQKRWIGAITHQNQ
jgi:hypothetical protein